MIIYRPSAQECTASLSLLLTRFADEDAARISRGVDLVPMLRYESAAERNGWLQAHGLSLAASAGAWLIDRPAARRGTSDEDEPRRYECTGDRCQCWDHVITEGRCRHCYAVLAYRLIVNAKLDALAQAGRLDMRPAGRYAGLYDVVDCWGRTIAAAIYSAKLDKWRCENDEDVAGFAYWLTTDNQYATIGIERRGGYENV